MDILKLKQKAKGFTESEDLSSFTKDQRERYVEIRDVVLDGFIKHIEESQNYSIPENQLSLKLD